MVESVELRRIHSNVGESSNVYSAFVISWWFDGETGLKQWRIEGVLYVSEVRLSFLVRYDGYQVEAYGQVYGVFADVSVCRTDDAAYLAVADSLLWHAESCVFAGLDFYNHQCVVFLCHNVQFFMSGTPIPMPDGISLRQQIVCCYLLSFKSELVVCCHVGLSDVCLAKLGKKNVKDERKVQNKRPREGFCASDYSRQVFLVEPDVQRLVFRCLSDGLPETAVGLAQGCRCSCAKSEVFLRKDSKGFGEEWRAVGRSRLSACRDFRAADVGRS